MKPAAPRWMWLWLWFLWPAAGIAQAQPAMSHDVPPDAAGQGLALLSAGQPQEALEHFDAVIAQSPAHCLAQHGRGGALARLRRFGEAQVALEKAREVCADRQAEVTLDLAAVYMAQNNPMWAVRVLSAGMPEPSDPALAARRRALLAAALVDSGQPEDALEVRPASEPSPARNRDLRAWAALQQGRAHHALGHNRQARVLLATSAAAAADPALRRAAGGLLDLALRTDSPYETWYGAQAMAGLEFDSNALYDPETQASAGLPDAHAGRSYVSAALSLRPVNTGSHLLVGDAAVFRSFHFANESARQLDLTEFAGLLSYQYRWMSASGVDHGLRVRYQGVLDVLDGGDLLPRSKPFVFVESHGSALAWTFSPLDWLATRLSYAFDRRTFAELARDAWSHHWTVTQMFQLASGRVRLTVDANLRFDHADVARYSLWGSQVGLRATGNVVGPLDLMGGVSHAYRNHFDSKGQFDDLLPTVGRKDTLTLFHMGLSVRLLSNHLTLSAQYRMQRQRSRIPKLDFERHVVACSVGGQL